MRCKCPFNGFTSTTLPVTVGSVDSEPFEPVKGKILIKCPYRVCDTNSVPKDESFEFIFCGTSTVYDSLIKNTLLLSLTKLLSLSNFVMIAFEPLPYNPNPKL